MSLSRRQFFSWFRHPTNKTRAQRETRREALVMFVRTNHLPYDFSLTAEQEAELFAEVRDRLDKTSDAELFSSAVYHVIEDVVEWKIQPWREENRLNDQADRLKEIRNAAVDYVSTFLNFQASPGTLEQLRQRFGISDPEALEADLKLRIRDWVAGVEDDQLQQYDVFAVKDLVFAQLRSWC